MFDSVWHVDEHQVQPVTSDVNVVVERVTGGQVVRRL